MSNPAGGAIVNAVGTLRRIVAPDTVGSDRRYLVIATDIDGKPGMLLQKQEY
jgi:hypothetical protein